MTAVAISRPDDLVTARGGFVVFGAPGARPHLAMKPALARAEAHRIAAAAGIALALDCQPTGTLEAAVDYAERLVEQADIADGQVADLTLARDLGVLA